MASKAQAPHRGIVEPPQAFGMRPTPRNLTRAIAAQGRGQPSKDRDGYALRTPKSGAANDDRRLAMRGLAHDLVNAVATIQVIAEVSADQTRPFEALDRALLHRRLRAIQSAAEHALPLIHALEAQACLANGCAQVLHRARVDLAGLVRRIAARYEQTAPHHIMVIDVPSGSIEGEWDAAQLERAIANVLGNAIKYSPPAHEVRVNMVATERWVTIAIADEGIGIPASELEQVLAPYRRGAIATGRSPGRGLGLAVAKQVIEQHGGVIAIDSTMGVGTTVTVRLPRCRTL